MTPPPQQAAMRTVSSDDEEEVSDSVLSDAATVTLPPKSQAAITVATITYCAHLIFAAEFVEICTILLKSSNMMKMPQTNLEKVRKGRYLIWKCASDFIIRNFQTHP